MNLCLSAYMKLLLPSQLKPVFFLYFMADNECLCNVSFSVAGAW